jgi:hypothetical protein
MIKKRDLLLPFYLTFKASLMYGPSAIVVYKVAKAVYREMKSKRKTNLAKRGVAGYAVSLAYSVYGLKNFDPRTYINLYKSSKMIYEILSVPVRGYPALIDKTMNLLELNVWGTTFCMSGSSLCSLPTEEEYSNLLQVCDDFPFLNICKPFSVDLDRLQECYDKILEF